MSLVQQETVPWLLVPVRFQQGYLRSLLDTKRTVTILQDRYQLVGGVFNPELSVSIAFAEKIGIPTNRVYANLDQLVAEELKLPAEERMQVVSVLTPNFLHYPMAKQLLENGFNVICEKPMTMNFEEAVDLHETLKLANTIDDAIDKLNNKMPENPNKELPNKNDDSNNSESTKNIANVNGNNVVLQDVKGGNIQITVNHSKDSTPQKDSNLKQELLNDLKNNQIKEVFEQLNQLDLNEDKENILIMIQADWKQLESDKMMGILSHSEQGQQTRLIRSKLLKFIQNLE